MILNASELDASRAYPVIVVGAGAVGLTLAVALARAGTDVVLLEAGDASVTAESQAIFHEASWRGYPLEGLHAGRIRALGGTTRLWGGQLVRLDEIVFEDRPWVTDSGWPIGSEDLDEYYLRAFELLGLSKQIEDSEVWRRLRIAPPPTGPDIEFFCARWAPKTDFSSLFRRDIASDPRLHVVLNAPVVALSLADDRRTIRGVVVKDRDGKSNLVEGRKIVLANGTVEATRLLLLELVDGSTAPWNANPWLGRGFLEHIDASAGSVEPIDADRFHELFDAAFIGRLKYKPKLRLTADAQRRHRFVAVAADFKFLSGIENDLLLLKSFARGILHGDAGGARMLLADPRRLPRLARTAIPMTLRFLRRRRTYNPGDCGIVLRISAEQIPSVESHLHLLDTRDSANLPKIEIRWSIDGAELAAIATMGETVAAWLESHDLAHVRLDDLLLARSPDFMRRIDDANHQMGMARMATAPQDGVVDRDLKVFGTDNLYVAGAACFPTSGSANPTLAAIALGLRLSRHLAKP